MIYIYIYIVTLTIRAQHQRTVARDENIRMAPWAAHRLLFSWVLGVTASAHWSFRGLPTEKKATKLKRNTAMEKFKIKREGCLVKEEGRWEIRHECPHLPLFCSPSLIRQDKVTKHDEKDTHRRNGADNIGGHKRMFHPSFIVKLQHTDEWVVMDVREKKVAYVVLVGTGKAAAKSTADGIGGGGLDEGSRTGGKFGACRKCRKIETRLNT